MTCTDYFSIVFDNGIGVDEISRLCSNVHIVFIFETYTGSLSIFVLLNLWRYCSDANSEVRAIPGAFDKLKN